MSRTNRIQYDPPREAGRIWDATSEDRLVEFANRKPDHAVLAKMLFDTMKRKGTEF